jgi:hypothetical protein
VASAEESPRVGSRRRQRGLRFSLSAGDVGDRSTRPPLATPQANGDLSVPVTAFFLSCLLLGGGVLAVQFVLGAMGAANHDFEVHHEGADGFDLLSVRALSAALAFFGLVGLSLSRAGTTPWITVPAAVFTGLGAAVGVAALMRNLRRLEVDKSFDIQRAVGLPARVHLGVPGKREGAGKVHLTVHDRLMELDAVTSEDAIPAGTNVLVIDAITSDTVLVSRSQPLLEETNDV